LKEVLQRFELTNGCFLGIMINDASANYSITRELQLILQASAIEWDTFRNHIPCVAHIIQLSSDAFNNLERVKSQTLGAVKDFKRKAMLESIRCRPCSQV
jgi:hypothetical protein